MAIRIPSSKTYDRQNPKVRDNVIERIEVGAVEVLPDNEYETPVYNNTYYNHYDGNYQDKIDAQSYLVSNVGNQQIYRTAVAFTYVLPKYSSFEVLVPVVEKNKWNKDLLDKTDKDGNPNIKYSLSGKHNIYNANATAKSNDGEDSNIYYNDDISKTSTVQEKEGFFDLPSIEIKNENTVFTVTAKANITVNDLSNIKTQEFSLTTINSIEYHKINLIVLSGFIIWRLKGDTTHIFDITQGLRAYEVPLSGTIEEYIPTQIEINIYGNTIGIDLTDKTVYINGETQKKVHSVDGNELMQEGNAIIEKSVFSRATADEYDLDGDGIYKASAEFEVEGEIVLVENTSFIPLGFSINGNKATVSAGTRISGGPVLVSANISYKSKDGIEQKFKKTLNAYKIGKETATIRCSISDYHDYDSGEKMIAIDNSTGKMSFKMYDQVIPMVYGADGQDRPMSLYQNGTPKVFAVLGSKIYYDGAVWQELSLQEVDKDLGV